MPICRWDLVGPARLRSDFPGPPSSIEVKSGTNVSKILPYPVATHNSVTGLRLLVLDQHDKTTFRLKIAKCSREFYSTDLCSLGFTLIGVHPVEQQSRSTEGPKATRLQVIHRGIQPWLGTALTAAPSFPNINQCAHSATSS